MSDKSDNWAGEYPRGPLFHKSFNISYKYAYNIRCNCITAFFSKEFNFPEFLAINVNENVQQRKYIYNYLNFQYSISTHGYYSNDQQLFTIYLLFYLFKKTRILSIAYLQSTVCYRDTNFPWLLV